MLIFITCLVAALVVLLTTKKRYRWIYILYKTLPRDFKALFRFTLFNIRIWKWENNNMTAAKVFASLVKKHPNKIAFHFEDDTLSFKELDEYSNRVANYFLKCGLKPGQTVALLLENCPEYVGIWFGLSKIGVVTALINTNQTLDPLVHSIKASESVALIYGSNRSAVVSDVLPKLESLKLFQFVEEQKTSAPGTDLKEELKKSSTDYLKIMDKFGPKDKLLYIFTSGTTGLPKAAVITNIRFMMMSAALNFMTQLKEDDILYDALPLYHSAGGMVGVGQCLLSGVTVVIRKKFSASNFWKDCAKYNCTAAQYIGELCRYLLATPETEPIKHNVRIMMGNGLKGQIWNKFVKRFGVKKIYEFYGATEGNSNLINIDSTVGAVGFVPRYAGAIYPVTLIKCDMITGEPIRNKYGRCTVCKIGEPGVFIGKINPKKAVNQFSGYADKTATKKKVLENVFKTGDLYFNSGDILVQDELGYFYFKDRTGDTFRWKGENVATSEVEAVISNVVDLSDATVYGVEIPGTDGKAGMAAIVDSNKTLDINVLARGLKASLPMYSLPIFLRVMQSVPLTGTFKLKKFELQKDGFNINVIEDDVYFYDAKQGSYVPLTKDIYENLISGKVRV